VNTARSAAIPPSTSSFEAVFSKYKGKGLVVLGVPSNDFGGQEPGSNAEIKEVLHRQLRCRFPADDEIRRSKAPRRTRSTSGRRLSAARTPFRLELPQAADHPNGKLIAEFPTKTKPDAPEVVQAIEAALATPKADRSYVTSARDCARETCYSAGDGNRLHIKAGAGNRNRLLAVKRVVDMILGKIAF